VTDLFAFSVCVSPLSPVFLVLGIQTVRGAVRDTLGNGIGSLVFGLIFLILGVAAPGASSVGDAGLTGLCASGLLVAGVLALAGRRDYKVWQAWHKALRAEPEKGEPKKGMA
jgi:hypothetical protein